MLRTQEKETAELEMSKSLGKGPTPDMTSTERVFHVSFRQFLMLSLQSRIVLEIDLESFAIRVAS